MALPRELTNFFLISFAFILLAIPTIAYLQQLPEVAKTPILQPSESKQNLPKEFVKEEKLKNLPKDEQIAQTFLSARDMQTLRKAKQKGPLGIFKQKAKELETRGVLVG